MKTLKANNQNQALNQLKKIDELTPKQIDSIKNRTIRELDKDQYHVILVRKVNNIARQKYDVSLLVQQYTDRGFRQLKKSFVYLGFSKMIILHDPSKKTDEFDVNKAKKDELIEYAEQNNIDLGEANLVDEIREVVKTNIETK